MKKRYTRKLFTLQHYTILIENRNICIILFDKIWYNMIKFLKISFQYAIYFEFRKNMQKHAVTNKYAEIWKKNWFNNFKLLWFVKIAD